MDKHAGGFAPRKGSVGLGVLLLAAAGLSGMVPGGALLAFSIAVGWCGHEAVLAARDEDRWIGTADLACPRETLRTWGRSLVPGLVYLSPLLLSNLLLEAARLAPSEQVLMTAAKVVFLPAWFLGILFGFQAPAAISIAAVDEDVLGAFRSSRVLGRMTKAFPSTAFAAVSPFIFIAGLAIQRAFLSDRFDGVVFFVLLAVVAAVCGRLAGRALRRARME